MIRTRICGLFLGLCCLSALAQTPKPFVPPVKVVARALFNGKAMLEIDGVQRLLTVGKASPEGVVLLSSTQAGAEIQMGTARYPIKLDQTIGANFARGVEPKELRLAPESDGHYYVDGTIDGTAIRFVVDTGASSVAISSADAKRVGVLYRVDGQPMTVETAAGPSAAYRVKFHTVKIRTIALTEVEGIVIDGPYPSTALLGQSFLNRLDMSRTGAILELRER